MQSVIHIIEAVLVPVELPSLRGNSYIANSTTVGASPSTLVMPRHLAASLLVMLCALAVTNAS
jgi:hypothetical protein